MRIAPFGQDAAHRRTSTKMQIEVGQIFIERDNARFSWRVQRLLSDGIHVVVVNTDQPTRQKTIAIWALQNTKLYVSKEAGSQVR
jgi:hypothetical protein